VARGLLNSTVMRWLLALLVSVACATAWADPASTAGTDRAQAGATAAERKATEAVAKQADLGRHYADEQNAIDRLKTERPSWSRDRELRSALADASDTANQLTRASRDVAAAQTALATARRELIAAIDAELATTPAAPRAQQLATLRAKVAPAQQAPRKIVIPNCDADPAADPEELDLCAKALRDDEAQLTKQAGELDRQAQDLEQRAELDKNHKRAIDVARREDDQPQRSTPRSSGGDTFGAASPTSNLSGGDHTQALTDNRTFETDISVVLADVVDHATIDGLTRAQLSGDPAQRAAAAQKTRDAVKARLKRLTDQRAAIEARARALRGHK